MKAKIKETGEIINIADYAKIDLDICNSSGNPVSVSPEEIELIQEQTDDIDWEMRRYEIAKAAMQGILNNNLQTEYACSHYGNEDTSIESDIARFAVACADALIEELKKNK